MKVRVIARQGRAALVEWHEERSGEAFYLRSTVPGDSLQDVVVSRQGNFAEHSNPGLGIPYGVEWEAHLATRGVPEETAAIIANELRRMGIWGVADLEANVTAARAAFARGYGVDVQHLIRAARSS